jgi:hypothetical protein
MPSVLGALASSHWPLIVLVRRSKAGGPPAVGATRPCGGQVAPRTCGARLLSACHSGARVVPGCPMCVAAGGRPSTAGDYGPHCDRFPRWLYRRRQEGVRLEKTCRLAEGVSAQMRRLLAMRAWLGEQQRLPAECEWQWRCTSC